jgi:hypothetical protein
MLYGPRESQVKKRSARRTAAGLLLQRPPRREIRARWVRKTGRARRSRLINSRERLISALAQARRRPIPAACSTRAPPIAPANSAKRPSNWRSPLRLWMRAPCAPRRRMFSTTCSSCSAREESRCRRSWMNWANGLHKVGLRKRRRERKAPGNRSDRARLLE